MGKKKPYKPPTIDGVEHPFTLLKELLDILQRHCGETGANEGAVDTLLRMELNQCPGHEKCKAMNFKCQTDAYDRIGKLEAQRPTKDYFDKILDDDLCDTCKHLIKKAIAREIPPKPPLSCVLPKNHVVIQQVKTNGT